MSKIIKGQRSKYKPTKSQLDKMDDWLTMGHLLVISYDGQLCPMCLSSLENATINSSCNEVSFANTFNAVLGIPMANSTKCDLTYTSSAAVLYNMLVVEDKRFHVKPAPPIKNAWIVVLIVAE